MQTNNEVLLHTCQDDHYYRKETNKQTKKTSTVKDVEKLEFLYTVSRNVKWCNHMGNSMEIPLKIKLELSYNSQLRRSNPALCGNLEGWDGVGRGREFQEGGDIGIPLADSY